MTPEATPRSGPAGEAWRTPSPKEVAGALVGVAAISGLARMLSATLEVALVVGYDIDQASETFNEDERW